jgi:DNA excision repair protein ERCC-8
MFLRNLLHRQIYGKNNVSETILRENVLNNISLDDSRNFKIHRNENVTGIDVDAVDQRYTLVATGLGHIEIFDLHTRPVSVSPLNAAASPCMSSATSATTSATTTATTSATTTITKTDGNNYLTPLATLPRAHKRMITSIQWYPVDTGLFISSCRNGLLNLWDTNQQQVVWKLDIKSPINDALMSPIAIEHMLIAVAAQDSTIRLCDPRSGSSSHLLAGHTAEVVSLAWSPLDSFSLTSGSHDGSIRIWDIRKSGMNACVNSLNHHRTKGTVTGTALTSVKPTKTAPSTFERPNKRQKMDAIKQQRTRAAVAHIGKVTCVTYTKDGRYLMSAGTDNQMRCWDLRHGEATNSLTHYRYFQNPCPMKSWMLVMQPSKSNSNHSFVVHPIGSRDGKDGNISMYNMFSGQQVKVFEGHWERSNCGCYIDKGGEIEMLTGGADGTVMTWKYGGISNETDNYGGNDEDSSNGKSSNFTMSRVWGGEDNWSD